MVILLLGLLAVSFAAADSHLFQFTQFVAKYGKYYNTQEEFEYRYQAFVKNLARIDELNARNIKKGGQAVFGVNLFADMPAHEFAQRLMKNVSAPVVDEKTRITLPDEPLTDIDWRNYGCVTAVKDQGQCGSCWAHSATEATESFAFLSKKYSLFDLSVQQTTACTYSYNGCNGGWPYDAYTNAIIKRNGEDTAASYPYNIPEAGTCKFGNGPADAPVANIVSYKSPAKGQLANVLTSTGPPSVCLAAESWQMYTGGILKDCEGSVDHCVQAVGMVQSASEPYWIVRNSWGTSWGINGYIYLDSTVNDGDICHIQEYITYPTE